MTAHAVNAGDSDPADQAPEIGAGAMRKGTGGNHRIGTGRVP